MKRSREQKKAELLAEAEALIESLLDWDERTSKPNLRQIEDEVLELRRRFGQRLAKTVIEDQEAKQPAENAAVSAVWRGDALQRSEGGERREPAGDAGGGARLLLLCSLQKRAFSPCTASLSWSMVSGARILPARRCG